MSSAQSESQIFIDSYGHGDLCKKFDSKRIKFSQAEDNRLLEQVKIYGPKKWNTIAKALPGRTSRQCRDRFMNYLNGSLINGPWTPQEDEVLIQKFMECGPQWTIIKKSFVGRSSNNVKNRWYTHLSKRVTQNVEKTEHINQNYSIPSVASVERKFPPLFPQEEAILNFDLFLNRIQQQVNVDFVPRIKSLQF